MIALGDCCGFQIEAVNPKTGKVTTVGSASPEEVADMLGGDGDDPIQAFESLEQNAFDETESIIAYA